MTHDELVKSVRDELTVQLAKVERDVRVHEMTEDELMSIATAAVNLVLEAAAGVAEGSITRDAHGNEAWWTSSANSRCKQIAAAIRAMMKGESK